MEYLKDWRCWLMCLAVAAIIIISDEVWADEGKNYSEAVWQNKTTLTLKDFGIRPMQKLDFSGTFLESAVDPYEDMRTRDEVIAFTKESNWYDTAVEIAKKWTNVQFDITSNCVLQWKLNKLRAQYNVSKYNQVWWGGKVDLGKYQTVLGYTYNFNW